MTVLLLMEFTLYCDNLYLYMSGEELSHQAVLTALCNNIGE